MGVPYAKYGMTVGVITAVDKDVSCGIIVRGWPTWAIAAGKQGYVIQVIVVLEETWLNRTRNLFPEMQVIHFETGQTQANGLVFSGVQLWLVDGDLPRSLSLFVRHPGGHIITGRRVRYDVSPTHDYQFFRLSHSDCGGVTDSKWGIHVYLPKGARLWEPFERRSGRDLCSVVDTKLGGVPCPSPGKPGNTQVPKVIQIRPRTYHVGGLYPVGEVGGRFVAPSILSPTGWVRRKLSGRETCLVKDVAEEYVDKLNSKEVSEICKGRVFPLRVALAVLSQWDEQTQSEPRETGAKAGKQLKLAALDEGSLVVDEKKGGLLLAEESHQVKEVQSSRKQKAAEADDAQVPEYLWDDQLAPCGNSNRIRQLGVLRETVLRWVKRRLTREFLLWFFDRYPGAKGNGQFGEGKDYVTWVQTLHSLLSITKESRLDWDAGRECVARFANSTWSEWPAGSRPQKPEKDELRREQMKVKLEKVRRLGYISPGSVDSLTSYFSVPKGGSNIRMVYDGTKSGLNDAMWAPWFALPTVEAHLRGVGSDTFMGDIDIGDMFHNFMLHERIRRVAGIDLTPFFLEELATRWDIRVIWERWDHSAMGLKCSPYNTIQGALFMDEIIRGDPKDPSNVLRWASVRLNLPGSSTYRPHLAWVCLVRDDGQLACDFVTYVDDTRTSGNSREEARLVSRAVASRMNWLGIQEAARKRRAPCQDPGPWAGSVVHVLEDGAVTVSVTPERWSKAWDIVRWISDGVHSGEDLDFKTLERHRGFLVYVARTYPAMFPFLKGIHLTLDSWRPWRNGDGWKMTQMEIAEALGQDEQETVGDGYGYDRKAPDRVRWVPRLESDVKALMRLTEPEAPPHRVVRPRTRASVVYSFGDASGSVFGSSSWKSVQVSYYAGQWTDEIGLNSSNFRELSNLINSIEQGINDGTLENTEVFIFTDNTAAESAFFKRHFIFKDLVSVDFAVAQLDYELQDINPLYSRLRASNDFAGN
jgi:hypothetical protein